MSPKTSDEKLFLAERARHLLDDPMIKSFFVDLNEGILNAKRTATLESDVLQRKLDMMLQIADKFERIFKGHIETGKIVAHELRQKTVFNKRGL